MKIGILGSGNVAQTLGRGFLQHGYEVMLGTRDGAKLQQWAKQNPQARFGGLAEAAAFGEILVLAVKGTGASDALGLAGPDNLVNKVVIDTTNPIADAPPEEGVLKYFTSLDGSLLEQLQNEFPGTRFVKAWNSVGHAQMVNPKFAGGPPTMFICGNDAAAKQTTTEILTKFGWETCDLGKAQAARAIEPLCILWCIPGFLRGQWTHAFKLLSA